MIGDGQSLEMCELQNGKGKEMHEIVCTPRSPLSFITLDPVCPETRIIK